MKLVEGGTEIEREEQNIERNVLDEYLQTRDEYNPDGACAIADWMDKWPEE